MEASKRTSRVHPAWWTLMLLVVVAAMVVVCCAFFVGTFRSVVPVILTSDRSGLVMDTGARVEMRGIEVGRVAGIASGAPVSLKLDIYTDQAGHIPANVGAEIKATTVFGAKFVDLIPPETPSPKRIAAGMVLHASNIATEVNTVFQNLVGVLNQVDVAKLNAILSALAEGVRGQGTRIGEAISDANAVLTAVNPKMDTVAQDWRSFKGFTDAYSTAAKDVLPVLDAASTTSTTITAHAANLDALLLNTIGFSQAGIDLLAPNTDNLVHGINVLKPSADLLMKYNPEYTCFLVGSKWFLDNGGYDMLGGADGKSLIVDAAFLLGDDPYRYPDNLPVIAAKGGPGGKPGCGSLPDVTKNFPVRQLVTNTGWGTGVDIRPNPGIGHPFWADYLPVTRAVPEPPSIRGQGPPAIGPIPYPGAPPYGAPQYGPDGTPLYPGVPPPASAPDPGPPPPP